MPLLQCHNVGHRVGNRQLFRELSFSINEGSKVGLVGHNGAGKSTLLSILSGALESDEGDISRSNQLQLETVEQFLPAELQQQQLLTCLLDKIPAEDRDFSLYLAEKLLDIMGFSVGERAYLVGDLSGGQQNRLMFARAVINQPNLILFDEPTNHLDMKTLVFFEQYLQAMSASFVIISHDRAFLDAVTDRTVFLRDERLYEFSIPYSKAKKALQDRDEAAAQRLKQEEKTIKQLSESAKRLATWGKVYDNEKIAAKAKTMEKRIEKLEESKTFVSRGPGLSLTLDMQGSRANRALQVENHNVLSPDNKILFHIEDFYMRPGDRVALLGHNGTGKTSFIHQLTRCFAAGERQTIRFNPQCELGYYDQEIERLNSSHSMLESLRANCSKGTETDFTAGLIHAGFPYADMDKKVAVLSGGEMARLMFLIIRLNRPNYLILDEPTNHIDIQGKEDLEAQIIESNATVLITSHDRSFVDNIAERYVVIQHGKLIEINDPSTFYRETLYRETLQKPSSSDLSNHPVKHQDVNAPSHVGSLVNQPESSEETLLVRLIALEDKLAADLERKPKFQKPRLQEAWQLEIEDLQKQLD